MFTVSHSVFRRGTNLQKGAKKNKNFVSYWLLIIWAHPSSAHTCTGPGCHYSLPPFRRRAQTRRSIPCTNPGKGFFSVFPEGANCILFPRRGVHRGRLSSAVIPDLIRNLVRLVIPDLIRNLVRLVIPAPEPESPAAGHSGLDPESRAAGHYTMQKGLPF